MSAAASAGRVRSVIVPILFAIVGCAVLVSLGFWQLHRLAWKEALIHAVETRIGAPAVPAPGPEAWQPFDIDRFDYQHVALRGRFGTDEVHVYTVLSDPHGSLSGQGYWIVTPFVTAGGWRVFVNRGFVPGDGKGPAAYPPPPPGDIALDGVLRGAEQAGTFTPRASPETRLFFVRDPVEISAALGLKDRPVAPYTVDATSAFTPPGGIPQAGETRTIFPNSHLQYALTWFGLAIGLVGVTVAFVWRRLRGAS